MGILRSNYSMKLQEKLKKLCRERKQHSMKFKSTILINNNDFKF